jgi:hypothetical protein
MTRAAPFGNEVLIGVPRHERRRLIDAETRRRKSGEWGDWQKFEAPQGLPGGNGWCRDVRTVCKNGVFCVLIRPLPTGGFHLAISSLSQNRPTWWEMQRIKNELCGEEWTAVEVYPPQAEVVDEADMYHLWTMDPLPFTLAYNRTMATTPLKDDAQ